MTEKKKKPLKIRALNSLCAGSILLSVIYILFAGLNFIIFGILAVSLAGIGVPVISSGETFLEVLIGVGEAFIEGVMAIVEGIANAISSIF